MANRIIAGYLCNITHSEIINDLTKDGRFKSICKSIAKKPYLADDLYQEFFLALCEIKDDRLVVAKTEGYLEVLCVGIINNIWGKRYRVKKREIGDTHPLHELCNSHIPVLFGRPKYDMYDETYCGELPKGAILEERLMVEEHKIDFDEEKAKELIQQSMDSDDQNERFNSRVFYYSRFKYKSPLQFHKHSGIPARVCYYAYNNYKEQLIKKLCLFS